MEEDDLEFGEVYVKACSVIDSCVTPEQITHAKTYCNLVVLELKKLDLLYHFDKLLDDRISNKIKEIDEKGKSI